MAFFTHIIEHNFELAAQLYAKALVVSQRNATLFYSAAVFHQAHFVDSSFACELLQQAFRNDRRRRKHVMLEQMYYGRIVTFQTRNVCSLLHFAVFVEMVLRDFDRSRSIYRSIFDLPLDVDEDLIEKVKANYRRLKDAMALRRSSALLIQSFWRGLFSQAKLLSVLSNASRQRKAMRIIEKSDDQAQIRDAVFVIHFVVLNLDLARELYQRERIDMGLIFLGDLEQDWNQHQAGVDKMEKAIHDGLSIHEGTAMQALALKNYARFKALCGDREVAAELYQEALVKASTDVELISKEYAAFVNDTVE